MPGPGWTSRAIGAALSGVYQISRDAGMEPGQDMLAGMEEADACGATIVYGDQEQSTTLRRIAQELRIVVRVRDTSWASAVSIYHVPVVSF